MNTETKPAAISRRIDYPNTSPEAAKAMYALEMASRALGLEPALLELVRLRASQINGCAFCVDLHTREARKAGESERRLHLAAVWHEATLFSPRERAALAWTEAVTLVSETHVPDDVFALAKTEFSDTELVNLTLAIISINGWNRLAVSFRAIPDESEAT